MRETERGISEREREFGRVGEELERDLRRERRNLREEEGVVVGYQEKKEEVGEKEEGKRKRKRKRKRRRKKKGLVEKGGDLFI